MALIEITVDNPSLINTGEGDANGETADGDSSIGLSGDRTESDGDADLIGTVGTFVTALSALAGVLRQLRSEETVEDDGSALGFTDEDADAEADADTDAEPIIGSADGTDGTEDEALETGLEGEDEEDAEATDEEASGSGLGTKVAVLLVVVLVVVVLLSRGGDEDAEFEEFDA